MMPAQKLDLRDSIVTICNHAKKVVDAHISRFMSELKVCYQLNELQCMCHKL